MIDTKKLREAIEGGRDNFPAIFVEVLIDELDRVTAERDALKVDAERLDWIQFHGGRVAWGNDGEICRVEWSDRDDSYHTELLFDWRVAIDAAIRASREEA